MGSKQSRLTEGILLIVVVIGVLVWFFIRTWQPVTAAPAEVIPVVNVAALESPALDQLAELDDPDHAFGLPVAKPAQDQVGKTPLF